MSNNNKRRGCSGTIFLLLLVLFVSTLFVDLDAEDINKGPYSTTNNQGSFSVSFTQLTSEPQTTDASLPSMNFQTGSTTKPTQSTVSFTQSTTVNNLVNNSPGKFKVRYTDSDRIYNMLDDKQKQVYNELAKGLADGELNFSFEGISRDDFLYTYYGFLHEHPEFFWLDSKSITNSDLSGNLNVKLSTYSYWTYSNDREGYIDRLNKKVDEIIRGASHCVTDYDKIKYVHDYLVTNIVYDKAALPEINKTERSVSTEQTLSLYGALINGKCVCGGYSESFYYLTRALGVNTFYIQGYGVKEYHAWNYIEIDGQYYYMDVTWDDFDSTDYPKGIDYSYFCVNQQELFRDHTPDEDYPAPDCNGDKYNYHRLNGYYFTEYDFESVRNAFNDQKGQQFASIRFSNKKAYDTALKDLMDNNSVYDIELVKNNKGSLSYYHLDEKYVIILCIK